MVDIKSKKQYCVAILLRSATKVHVRHSTNTRKGLTLMSIQPFKEKLITLLVVVASAGGTLAVFGSVPVIARITSAQSSVPQPYTQQANPFDTDPIKWL
jgi:hypothetical protein